MTNAIQVFNFEGNKTRVVMMDGEPWFVAKDVCEALGYVWNGVQRIAHVPEEWRGVTSVVTPSGIQEMNILSEQGLYFFLGRSDKPAALPYQKTVAGVVMPSIRKTGSYSISGKTNDDETRRLELKEKRLNIMEKNANARMAKLMLQGMKEFQDVMTPESKKVFMVKYAELTSGESLTSLLPIATEKWYSASEIAAELGVSANRVGKIANVLGVKAPEGQSNDYGTWIRSKSQHSNKEIMTWVYYEAGREKVKRCWKQGNVA